MKLPILFLLLSGCLLTQCVYTTPNAKPMRLDEALEEVAIAIRKTNAEGVGQKKTGLMASDVVVTLNVENVAKDEGGVNLSVVPAAGASFGGNWTGSVTSTHGNTISITYKNVLFAPADSVVGSKTAAQSLELVDQLTEGTGGNIRKTSKKGTTTPENSAVGTGLGGTLQREVNDR